MGSISIDLSYGLKGWKLKIVYFFLNNYYDGDFTSYKGSEVNS